jgi:hypothetical protein
LSAGTYTLELVSSTPGASQSVSSKTVTILRAPDKGVTAPIVCPNPAVAGAAGGTGTKLAVLTVPGQLLQARAALYNGAGEQVAQGADLTGSGTIWLDYGRLAAGVYLVRVQALLPNGDPYSTVVKAAIVH